MKWKGIVLSVVVLLSFSSCKKLVSNQVSSLSPNEVNEIVVKGERYVSTDPWLVTVQIHKRGKDDVRRAQLEMQARNLDSNNVKIEWRSDNRALVRLYHQDGAVEKFPIVISGK